MTEELNEPNKAADNRRPDGTFGPGNNANPAGRPKGKSLKEYWRQRFSEMSDEEKKEFSEKVAPELLWRMAEGNPTEDKTLKAQIVINVESEIAKKHAIDSSTNSDSEGQSQV